MADQRGQPIAACRIQRVTCVAKTRRRGSELGRGRSRAFAAPSASPPSSTRRWTVTPSTRCWRRAFAGKDLPRLKQLGTQFFCAGSGGPQGYEGRDLRTAHTGMNINEQELVAAIDDFVAALQNQGVAAPEVNDVVSILYSMKGDVLGA